jgi:hypothetical protein
MGGVWWCSPYEPLSDRSGTLPGRFTEQSVYYYTDLGEDRGKLIRRRTRLSVTQGEDQTESQDPIEHACLESG